jgi:pilus assembly protein CpaE
VGVVAAKGGLGTSTLALNVGVSLVQKNQQQVIVAEFCPGHGSIGPSLGYVNPDGVKRLLGCEPLEITSGMIEKELVPSATGVRLLLASTHPIDVDTASANAHYEAILDQLTQMSPIVIVDFGTIQFPKWETLLGMCNEAVVVVEPNPLTVTRTKALLEDLTEKGFGMTRLLTVAMVNRIRADVQHRMAQMQETLGVPIAQVIPPAPEVAFQAANRNIPLIQVQIGGIVSQQYSNLAERLTQRVPV